MAEQYVGIDLHRRRTVIVRMTPSGEVLDEVRIENDVKLLVREVAKAGPAPEVVLEATYGWYWAVDALEEMGASVHLAHPSGVRAFAYQRVKRDGTDARLLADLLRANCLPEAWIAPRPVRELRELVRYRSKLVGLRSGLKSQIHAVLAKEGIRVPMTDLFGEAGNELLDTARFADAYTVRLRSLRDLIDMYGREIVMLEGAVKDRLVDHAGYRAIMAVPGIGPVIASVLVAEIGDVSRFRSPEKLASWAGLTPRHRESDTTLRRGHITKQGSAAVRWAAVEAIHSRRNPVSIARRMAPIRERRGPKIAIVAGARMILELVYWGLRDGHIRCLDLEDAA